MAKIWLSALACFAIISGWALPDRGHAQPAPPAGGPSFSCQSASGLEDLICHDAGLSTADRRLAALYQAARGGAAGQGSNQLFAQRQWLKDRDARCSGEAWKQRLYKTLRACLVDQYDERIKALAVADLISAPQLSLEALRAVASEGEPYYAALQAYATIDNPSERAKVVEARLAPLYAKMSPQVRNGLDYVGKQALTARQAASSDAGFAQVFDIASMQGDLGLTWSCAALIKRPGLIVGLGAIWGGAIDGRVPSSDCDEALPSPWEPGALSEAAFKVQPSCAGTIRFSTSRDHAMLEDAIRLRRSSVWQGKRRPISEGEAMFRRKNAPLVDKTVSALTTYYMRYFPAGTTTPAADAKAATDALIASAFGYCGGEEG